MSLEKAKILQAESIIKELKKRNITGEYVKTKEEAKNLALSYMPAGSVVSWGGSESVKEIGLRDAVIAGDYQVVDRSTATTPEEERKLYSQTVMADYYLMSSNAITLDGELINIDGTGNRVACLSYGPQHVIVVVGMNKVANNIIDGIDRVRNFASPPNTIRLDKKTPCSMTGRCGDCYGDDCICSQFLITRRQSAKQSDRIKVILVEESLGF